ncbi:response regulator transcription factor [Pedobacter sp. Leaf194]|uniref:response regulator transcription factor n=1 Tax=Pedobacter sp. Leaf194 TaxID=1736297 RepID=UPI000702C866|nr:response regulator [Pedobacter sp. Leaf194]KQS41933.1 hypothetical protein ASG14_05695 [Pedobacter sp. Leaf194]
MEKKILFLDDDPLALTGLDAMLTGEGYRVCCVSSATSLADAMESFAPHLLILDIWLPDGDGRLICNQLKTGESTKHIPIIMLTALTHEEIGEIECDADAIIGKPFNSSNLIRTIEDLLDV